MNASRGQPESLPETLPVLRLPTPLVAAPALSRSARLQVWLKLESLHPTGSHKDRESALAVAACRREGRPGLGCASAGNLALSLAYFAWHAGLECHVWLAKDRATLALVDLLEAFSARLHLLDGGLEQAYVHSSEEMERLGLYDANPGVHPLKRAAGLAIGAEILDALEGIDAVVCPVNNGSCLLGLAEGLRNRPIRLFGIYSHSPHASSIRGFHAVEGRPEIERTVARSGGRLLEIADDELRRGLRALFAEGVVPETSSAAAVGALERLGLPREARVVCLVTGSGFKKSAELRSLLAAAA